MNKKCDYGCNGLGIFVSKNNKWRCSESVNQCPAKRLKDSLNKKGKDPFASSSHPKGMLGKEWKHKGKTAKEIYGDRAEEIKKRRAHSISEVQKNFSLEKKQQISKKLSDSLTGKTGGPRKNSGQGHKGYYKGIWCDSSYELAYVYWCIENNISMLRNKKRYSYVWNGKEKGYYPDFIANGELVEIKGYANEEVESKMSQCSDKLTILRKHDLTEHLELVTMRYGKKFWEVLYSMEDGQDGNAADC